MIIKIIKTIVIFSLLLYLSSFIYLKIKHPFWFSQPVSQYTDLFKTEGIITKNIPKPIKLDNYLIEIINTEDKKNINDICNLLNNNYNIDDSYRFNYDEKFIRWTINTPYKHYNIKSENKWSLGIYDKGQLISYINGKPIDLYIDNQNLPCFYIDYLCIDKKYRKQNLAQSIITHMANNGFVDYFKLFIFKKELFPLPFKFISKYNYYIINKNEINNTYDNLTKIDKNIKEENIMELYKFYTKYIINHRLYNKYHYQEFKHYFKNDSVSFYRNKIGNLNILIGIYDSKINYNKTKTADFLFIIINNKEKYQNSIEEIINKEAYKYNYFLINNMSQNEKYIKIKKLEKISQCFLHFYNYHNDNRINSQDICLNIP